MNKLLQMAYQIRSDAQAELKELEAKPVPKTEVGRRTLDFMKGIEHGRQSVADDILDYFDVKDLTDSAIYDSLLTE